MTVEQLVDRLLEADQRADSPISAAKRRRLAELDAEYDAVNDHDGSTGFSQQQAIEAKRVKLRAYLKRWDALYATCR